ncbi:MAG: hypothetical protein ACREHG_02935, partial [Candidatus Saccharimonadales bacterium]
MTDIDIFRNRTGDRVKSTAMNAAGNGSQMQYDLQYQNIQNLQVIVNGTVLNLTTGYTLDALNGLVTFITAPADAADIQFAFQYSAFSDADVTDLVGTFGTSGAVLEGIKMLLSDAARLYNYTKGMNQSQRQGVFKNLSDLYDLYMKHGVDGTANSVSIAKRHVRSTRDRQRSRLQREFYDGYL